MSKCAELVRAEMADDTIHFTKEEYATCIENFEDGALNDAARKLFKSVKRTMDAYWKRYNKLESNGCTTSMQQLTKLTATKLDAYKDAFEVLGYPLSYEVDWFDGRIYKVHFAIGCIADMR